MTNNIESYLQLNPRNKLIISRDEIAGINYLDVGVKFSQILSEIPLEKHFAMNAKLELERLLDEATSTYENLHLSVLALKNPGILLEPDLKLDFPSLLDRYSKENALFLKWDGEVDGGKLYFLSREKGVKINIKNLSHLIV